MAPKTKPAVRAIGRRRTAAETAQPEAGSPPELTPEPEGLPEETKAPVDPAVLAASILLASGLRAAGLKVGDVTAPGAISLVRVPAPDWVSLVRDAWVADISGETGTEDGLREFFRYRALPKMLTFDCGAEPDRRDQRHGEERFARAVALRVSVVGISPHDAWLPADLVAAADYRIDVALPSCGGRG